MRDTAPEIALRKALHALGLRFRIDRQPLPTLRRRADIVFGPARVAVFVDGCFWHSCPQHGNQPRTHSEWWKTKLERNKARDRDTDQRLTDAGWLVARVWEHDDAATAAAQIAHTVRARRINSSWLRP